MTNLPELPVYYYHDNFLHLLEHVYPVFQDLLTEEEQDFYHDFLALSDSAQQLYIRLICRRGDLFRVDKLSYTEIQDITSAISELEQYRFLSLFSDAGSDEPDTESALKLFNKQELIEWLSGFSDIQQPLKSWKRARLDEHILALIEDETLNLNDLIQDNVILVYGDLEFTIYRLLFFGNLYQDFTDFVLNDLGIYQYESYTTRPENRLFHTRDQIDQALAFSELRNQIPELKYCDTETLTELGDALLNFLQSVPDDNQYANQRLNRQLQNLINEVARELERQEATGQALSLFSETVLPPSRERRCRILEKQSRFTEAAELCSECFTAPYNEQEKQFSLTFRKRLHKNLTQEQTLLLPVFSYSENTEYRRIQYQTGFDEIWQEQGVEMAAATEILHLKGGDCFYVENTLFTTMFGLYYWDLIFCDSEGAFVHPFQFRPLDLYENDFFERRSEQKKLLGYPDNPDDLNDLPVRIMTTFRNKQDIASVFVHWPALTEELLELAIERIPLNHWNAIFKRIRSDIKHNRAGLPDLIHFPEDSGYELIEVKGPGDTLQKNQKGWLDWFELQGIPYHVADISYSSNPIPE